MDNSTSITTAKYQKLSNDYNKLRAQTNVLRNSVQDEQTKNVTLRQQLQFNETAMRRNEQEIESLEFRNKQLEHRVAVLQEEIAQYEGRKKDKKRIGKQADKSGAGDGHDHSLVLDDLQNKIIENAQLTLLLNEKERELALHVEHIGSLEKSLRRLTTESGELERRLRHEIEQLQQKNTELETKLVEAASMLGSEDALSVTGSDITTLHHNTHNHSPGCLHSSGNQSNDEQRLAALEKEVVHWRTRFELAIVQKPFHGDGTGIHAEKETPKSTMMASHEPIEMTTQQYSDLHCSNSTTAACLVVQPSFAESRSAKRDSLKDIVTPPTKEQLIYNKFSKKFEDLLEAKCLAASRVRSYETESEHLQNCLEQATYDLKAKDEQIRSVNQTLRTVEEDLATTRTNYEEQISVLTEQVISLSEQLAACK